MIDSIKKIIDPMKNYWTSRTRRMRVFLKSFVFTLLSFGTLSLVFFMAWGAVFAPPEQPEFVPAPPRENNTAGALGYWETTDITENECPWTEVTAPSWVEGRRPYFWTFLVVGLNEGTNANTVMVASYCGVTREANIVSIPRDVPVHPNRNGRKLSSSYMIGYRHSGVAGGAAQVQTDVQTVIGFVPDYYVVIDYDAFFKIIDAVGGIYIDVPMRMRYHDPFQDLDIDIQPGLQHMDSETALHFARFRQGTRNTNYPGLPDGDIGRTRNQQEVIRAVIDQVLSIENLTPSRLNEFMNIFNSSVHTNMSIFRDIPFFANEIRHVTNTDSLMTYTFPTHSGMSRGVSYQFLTPASVVEIVNETINPFDGEMTVADLRIVRQ